MADIEKYSQTGRIIVMGDFNARTASLSDLVVNDRCENIPWMREISDVNIIPNRHSQDADKRACTFGSYLIQ